MARLTRLQRRANQSATAELPNLIGQSEPVANNFGSSMADLPDELLLAHVLSDLGYIDLCRLAISSRRLQKLAACDGLWRELFETRWGSDQSSLHPYAAHLAGSYRNLMRSKHQMDASSGGWTRPCQFELTAVLHKLANTAANAAADKPAACAQPPTSPTSHLSASFALSPAPSTSTSVSLHRTSTASSPSSSSASIPHSPPASSSMPTPFSTHHRHYAPYAATTSSMHPSTSLPSSASQHSARVLSSTSPSAAAGMMMRMMPSADHDLVPPPPPPEVQLVYLLDGSGSVSEEDFNEMKRFVVSSTPVLFDVLGAGSQGKVGVIQFSTEPRVEVPLARLEEGVASLATALDGMVRMNGGTNIATAIARAGALMKAGDLPPPPPAPPQPPPPGAEEEAAGGGTPPPPPPPPPLAGMMMHAMLMGLEEEEEDELVGAELGSIHPNARTSGNSGSGGSSSSGAATRDAPPSPSLNQRRPVRLLLLLTDGRVDTYQAREARATACRLCDELWGCTLAAFGVGRGVDRAELLHIIDTPDGDAASRYLDLFTRDDAPW